RRSDLALLQRSLLIMRIWIAVLLVLPMCKKPAPMEVEVTLREPAPPAPPALRFVSPDGAVTIVLEQLPDASPLSFGAIEKHGKPVADLTPETLHLARSAMRVEDGKVRWLGERPPR